MSAKALPKKITACSKLKIVIVCEDLECGKHAKELEDQLALSLQSRIEVVPEVWTFRALLHPELQELAAREINEAEIILLSMRGHGEIPSGIKRWLETALKKAEEPKALVVLFREPKNALHVHSTRLYLEEVAAMRALDFFVDAPQASMKRPVDLVKTEV